MKKLILIALALLLAAALVVAIVVMPKNLTISDAVAAEGDIVNLTVSLKKPVTANAMAISYDYDASVLEPMSASNQWIPQGSLQNFSDLGFRGVWASGEAVAISGDVCTLAFRVLPNAEYKRSTVRCTLTLRDADSENKFTASAKITPACNHKYSPWVDAEHGEHSRTCSLCSHVQLQSHTWDNGKPGEPIGDLEGTLYTCTACGSQQNVPVNTFPQSNSSGAQAPWGNDLSGIGQWGSSFGDNTTEPTQPSSPDNQPSSSGNQVPWGKDHSENDQEGNNLSGNGQWGNPFGDNTPEENTEPTQATTFANNPWMDPYLQPNQETTPPTEDPLQNQTPIWMEHLDTSIFQETTAPAEDSSEEEHDHSQTAPTVDPHAGHDHTQINQEINPLTVCILLGVLVLGLIVALLFLKKKKRH